VSLKQDSPKMPMAPFDFENLFVLDLANNHQGSVEHGINIIRGMGRAARQNGVRAAVKFQFRQLDTFIHPAHRNNSTNKHVPRFLGTELKRPQYEQLLKAIREEGLLAMCTPFDEESVDIIVEMGFDIMKVASCSAKDWPLLEKIAGSGLPVVFSTGGLVISEVDDLVSFMDHRGVDYAMMYCVSIYPIPETEFHLNQVEYLRARYPRTTIGWSTHEDPDEQAAVAIAYAKGARMFERHVGVATDSIKLNAYSSTPEQVDRWMASFNHAKALCGSIPPRLVPKAESDSILDLKRGVFAREPLVPGQVVTRDQVYFAMPAIEGQLDSGLWKEGIVPDAAVAPDGALMLDGVALPAPASWTIIKSVIHDVKAMLNEARIPLSAEFEAEFSHHYGMERFREFGTTIISCINRKYCKKILVQLPGQKHPQHYHQRKEETFQVLFGELNVNIDGHQRVLRPGDTALVLPGVWHSFWSDVGCVFEEVSTTHYNDDSFYGDKSIAKMTRAQRKTQVQHWGRFQMVSMPNVVPLAKPKEAESGR
jgi:N-acetylneuraminate synthase